MTKHEPEYTNNPNEYMTHGQHTEYCKRSREWSEAKVRDSERDREGLHEAVRNITISLQNNKTWLIGTLLTIVIMCLGTIGYLFKEGGFAKYTDVTEIKGQVLYIKLNQEIMAKTVEEIRNDQIIRNQQARKDGVGK